MLPTDLSSVSLVDLRRLVANQTPESRHLEYKLHLPGRHWNEMSFLETVASFANDGAGDLLLGVAAENGIPSNVPGCAVSNVDGEVLRLDQLIRDRLDPIYRQHRIHPVVVATGKAVFILRLPLSFSRPHRVGSKGAIMGRGAAGKFPLDMAQVREMLLEAHGFTDRARAFRSERVRLLHGRVSPVPLADGPVFVAHVVPLQSLASPTALSAPDMDLGVRYFRPMVTISGFGFNYNLEGTVFWEQGTGAGYTHVYRTGIIEATLVFDYREPQPVGSTAKGAFIVDLEEIGNRLLKGLPAWLAGLEAMEIGPPYFLLLSMCRTGDAAVPARPNRLLNRLVMNRTTIEVPDVEIPWPTDDLEATLRTPLDILSQAFGRARSYNYDGDGRWVGV